MGQQSNEATAPDARSARELTRRLVARSASHNGAPDGVALAVHAACERTYRELTRTLGAAGSQALLTRAVAQTQVAHPLIRNIHVGRQSKPHTDGVSTMVEQHGAAAVAAGLESLLETLLGQLGRLIGDDMVARLVEPSAPIETPDDGDRKR